ncbi:MAG: Co2+/Mg2+ efflux protein ApaG [Pseudomonadota bacterium]
MYERTTHGVKITVTPEFLEEQSEPEDHRFVWAYTVRIANERADAVSLRTRTWRITDALGRTQIVRGDGVVGEQPQLQPGSAFEYTSGAPLQTPSGLMSGEYGMETEGGEAFDAEIPAFSLDSPHEVRQVN